MFERLSDRYGPPDDSVFECVACGAEFAEVRVDCPECRGLVVRVVVDDRDGG